MVALKSLGLSINFIFLVVFFSLSLLIGISFSSEKEHEDTFPNRSDTELVTSEQKEGQKKSLDTPCESTDTNSAVTHKVLSPKTHDDVLQTLLLEKASEELGRTVKLLINKRRQLADWMFLVGTVRELNGDLLDYQSTRYAIEWEEGMLDEVVLSLAQLTDGKWTILAFSFGGTDAPFFDWSENFDIPLTLFIDETIE